MIRLRKFNAAAALGGLTATVALLAGMPGAHAQSALGGGSFPGSILIPGGNTSFKIGGYVKGDYVYDFSSREGFTSTSGIGTVLQNIPLDDNGGPPGTQPGAGHSIHGTSGFSAAESRFNIETRTPTSYGELKTFIEGDFVGPSGLNPSSGFQVNSNSSGFRLRLAYGTLGPFLVGQFPGTFRDTNSEPELLDFGGPIGAGILRQPQFRYTYDAGNGLTIAGAIENPQTQVVDQNGLSTSSFGAAGGSPAGRGDKLPDFVGKANLDQPWGHVAFRAVLRDISDHNGIRDGQVGTVGGTAGVGGSNDSNFGWGVGISGDLKTWGKDDLIAQANGGNGIGRYSNNLALTPDAITNTTTGQLRNLVIYSGLIGYQHWWTETLRTTVVGSYLRIDYPSGAFNAAPLGGGAGLLNSSFYTAHVNLIWSPVPQVDTGIEYIRESRTVRNGQSGDLNRVQVSTKFKF